ncbi:MAG: lysophospholipase [Deltaproteobacteria bacterium]|nr:lysophospholipase [Deltaproteobacteria bacterium]
MKSETFKFKTKDNADIFTYKWLPDNEKEMKAVVQLSHGMAEHGRRYERFAGELTGSGYGVYINDHRGHGKTAGSVEALGFFADENGWNLVVEDMHQLTGIIKENHPDLPVFLLGHSMGSFLSRNYIYLYGNKLKGVLLSGTAGDPGLLGAIGILLAKRECKKKGKKTKSPLLDKLSFGSFNKAFKPARTDFDWLSRDDKEVDKYIDDPYCGEVFTAGFYLDLLGGIKAINLKSNTNLVPKDLPMFLFAGDMDPVGKNSKGVKQIFKAYEKAGILDVSCKLYNEGRHEMLNETNREEVFSDIIKWLNNHM